MKFQIRHLRFIILVLVMSVAVSACGNNDNDAIEEVIKKQVEVQQISQQASVAAELSVSGTVVPAQHAIVRALTQGTLEYLAPVGSEVKLGQALFSIRDRAIEDSYFNALSNFEQTSIVGNQRVQQAELALNGARAKFDLSQSQFASTVAQTEQNLKVAEDSALVAYGSAYNSLTQIFNFLSVSGTNSFKYKFRNILSTKSALRSQNDIDFANFVIAYQNLQPTITADELELEMDNMSFALNKTKKIVDNTLILLQSSIAGASFSEIAILSSLLDISSAQTLTNGHVSAIITANNNIVNARINNRLSINQAQNSLDLSQIDYDNSVISLDNANNGALLERNIAQTLLDGAAYGYSNLSLAAPFSGTVLSHKINVGEQTSIAQELIELGDLSIVEISVDVDVAFARAINLGDQIAIDGKYGGIVAELEPIGDLASGKVAVLVQAEDANSELVPGSISEIKFDLTYDNIDSIIIPIKSVTIEAAGNFVFVVEDGKIARRKVTLGQVFGNKVSIANGLEEGDQLVILDGVFVSVGDEVEIVEK